MGCKKVISALLLNCLNIQSSKTERSKKCITIT